VAGVGLLAMRDEFRFGRDSSPPPVELDVQLHWGRSAGDVGGQTLSPRGRSTPAIYEERIVKSGGADFV